MVSAKGSQTKTSLKKKVRYLPGPTQKLNDFIKPMLAKETDIAFSDKDWIYEIKWDGYRAVAEVNKNQVNLYSRNGNTFNDSYPVIVDALSALKIKAVLDGEVVAMDNNGKSDFQLLQYYKRNDQIPLEYRVFDILELNGENVCDLPLIDRKKLLKELLPAKNPVIKYSDHIDEQGQAFFEMAVNKDLEGIMAKKADSLYHPGVRTTEWLKIKNHKSQEVVICGFTEPGGSRKYFGALVLGIMKGNKLVYAGHTGSGFNDRDLKEISKKLKPLIQKQSPFKEVVKTNMPVTWVRPVLLGEVKFTEFTRDGRMRHPIFLRLRTDKEAKDINSEPMPKKDKIVDKADEVNVITFGKTKVKTTHPEKIFWPDEKITKGDMINYYISINKYILPYLKGRPQSLKRNPNGIKDSGFYHKDAGDEAPDYVKSYPVYSESNNKDIDYIICDNAATLTYMNNLGCIEINPWHSTIKALDKPDYVVIDIDPSKKNKFDEVIEAANIINAILKRIKVTAYCKTSGATGLHIYIPTQKKYTYEQLKDFAHIICLMAQQELPSFTTLERNLKKRGDKMIYLDHLQNRRGQTISSVYSLRPVKGACVSMPLDWKEVKPGLSPHNFTIKNALSRIEKKGDIFKGVLGKGIDLKKCLKALEKM
jgi:bifunctional non-homologous end joining protein LigD